MCGSRHIGRVVYVNTRGTSASFNIAPFKRLITTVLDSDEQL